MINRATTLACIAAYGQTRKDGLTPQVMHPLAVQRLLAQAGIEDERIQSAGLLHDAIEDLAPELRAWLRDEIERTLGTEVLALVEAMTDDCPPHWSRARRKERQMTRIADAPWAVKVIKLADLVASMMEGPAPGWSQQYAADYLYQRTKFVNHVLQSSSALLARCYQQAVEQPVWQVALGIGRSYGAHGEDSPLHLMQIGEHATPFNSPVSIRESAKGDSPRIR